MSILQGSTDLGQSSSPQETSNLDNPSSPHLDDSEDLEDPPRSPSVNVEDSSNISRLQITSTSIQVQFPDITGGNLMYVESRLVARNDPPWENAIILQGNEIFTLTALKPGTQYTLRWNTKDRTYPDVNVATLAFDVQKPKVIITGVTHDSVTLAFDDFRPLGYQHGYVAQWRRVDSDQWMTSDQSRADDDLLAAPAVEDDRDTPSLTIESLSPNTSYVAKVSIYDDFTNRVFGKSTEEIKVVTGLGCVHQGESHPVGSFVVECESSCQCHPNGTVACQGRCHRPLHNRGAFKDDPLCVESFSDSSECCVVVTCSHHAGESSPCDDTQCGPNAECKHAVLREEETLCLCKEGYTGDPDSAVGCAIQDRPVAQEVAAGCIVNSTSYSPAMEWFDGCQYRCTCSQKLEILCQPRCKLIAENVDSRCELKPDPEDSCCQTMVCPTDNNNTDILQPSLPFDGCVFKNETYTRDERFYDGCHQQCHCIGYGDMVCLARCPPTNPGDGENCYTLPDITDNCCNVTICDKPADIVPDVEKLATNATLVVSNITQMAQSYPNETIAQEEQDVVFVTTELPVHESVISSQKKPRFDNSTEDGSQGSDFGGCLHQGEVVNVGSEFFQGCDMRCVCVRSNRLSCRERCPPIPSPAPKENCVLIPDPQDSCCNVLQCSAGPNQINTLTFNRHNDLTVEFTPSTSRTQHVQGWRPVTTSPIVPSGTTSPIVEQTSSKSSGTEADETKSPIIQHESATQSPIFKATEETAPKNIADTDKISQSETPIIEDGFDNRIEGVEDDSAYENNDIEVVEDDNTYENKDMSVLGIMSEDTVDQTPESTQITEDTKRQKTPRGLELDLATVAPRGQELVAPPTGTPRHFPSTGRHRTNTGVSPVYVGEFVSHHHEVGGVLYVLNSSSLLIKNFTYDGSGPDVFFWAGSSPQPSRSGWILPYPFTGTFYNPQSGSAPVLGRFTGEDVVLHLPPQIALHEVQWLSVWCRFVGINFGEVQWPDNFNADAAAHGHAQNDIGEDVIESESSGYDDDEVEPVAEPSLPLGCTHNEQTYKVGEEFHDGCSQYCRCDEDGSSLCLDIECPSSFGLDVINPNCIVWDRHDSFVASPPMCCPPVPVCVSDGSCLYKGHKFSNYDAVPKNLTGCLQRCHCQDGEIECQDACYQISEQPPSWVPCPRETAILVPNQDRECCKVWGCPENPGRLVGTETEAVNATSLAVMVNVPQSIDGATGYYQIAFTSGIGSHPNPEKWPVKKLNPDGDRINAERGRVRLIVSDLLPNAEYFLRASVVLDNGAEPWTIPGDIVNARTLPVQPSVTEPVKPEFEYLDLQLAATDISTNSARLTWRAFSGEEKPYIDGVQLRYAEIVNKLPVSQLHQTSPFIHRETKEFVLEGLEPGKQYEVKPYLIPVPNAPKEYISGRPPIIFETKPFIDVFDFKMKLVVENATSQSVDISWSGVPSPDQKFIHVYRLIYHAKAGPNQIIDEASVFKISKIDSPKRAKLERLDPGVSYTVWLEAYLTNGKTKQSQVETFRTLPADLDNNFSEELRSGSGKDTSEYYDDYYNSMVAAAIVAAFAILAFIIVLYFYLRRNTTYKATITKDRPNYNPAYDNHGFKGYENERAASPQTSQSIEMNGINGHASPRPDDPA